MRLGEMSRIETCFGPVLERVLYALGELEDVDDDRPFLNRSDTENGDIRLIDHGRPINPPKTPGLVIENVLSSICL